MKLPIPSPTPSYFGEGTYNKTSKKNGDKTTRKEKFVLLYNN